MEKENSMIVDDLRGLFYIALKDLRAYYLKPPNISWGILFPFAFFLAFIIRNPGDVGQLVPGLIGLTILFSTTSMEAIVITFERRIGSLERLFLSPVRLPAILAGKMMGGMIFGIAITAVVAAISLIIYPASHLNWVLLLLAIFLSALSCSALGSFVSVAVKEVFEAQTLANFFRFPMMFLGGVFVPVGSLPLWLQVIARCLPLTYSVEALRNAIEGTGWQMIWVDLGMLLVFSVVLYGLSVFTLTKRMED
jgi:ABC-2 type transport system permease protein